VLIMLVCPDCRNPTPCSCGWTPKDRGSFTDWLSTKDRSGSLSSYIDTYDLLAEHNQNDPTLSNRYVEHLARRFMSLIEVTDKDFCDVGSGRGYLVGEAIERKARSITAVDIAARSLEGMSTRGPITAILANAENLPFERHFDVMTATDIVEHVLNVANFLVTANWSLKDGGVLAVRVPFRENMIWYSNFHGLPMHYTHLRTFDRRLIVDLLECGGFKVRRVHYDGFLNGRMQPWLDWIPKLKARAIAEIQKRFEPNDVTSINPTLGLLLMRPAEISVVAVKVEHLAVRDMYEKLGGFARDRTTKRRQ
jgi:SAM-dependent methyltransferase